jgi:hypothetical protein
MMIVSCQKELNDPTITGLTNGSGGSGGGGGSTDITGNWKFVSFSAVTQSTNQFTLAGLTAKTVTNSDYTTTNNTGTVTITSNNMTINAVSYDVADTAFAFYYENNVLIDTISQGFGFHLPSYNATSTYKRVNQDSIYINSQVLDPSVSGGSGYRISLNGNILKMTTSIVKDTSINMGGYVASQHETATAVTTLQRQ